MREEELNINYIREKTGLVENDELVPIILEMIKDSYKAGLCQSEFDNTMGLIEENQELKKQLEENQNPLKGIFAQVNDDTLLRDCGNMNAEINELKNQQKEFIEYLENEIELCELTSDLIFNHNKEMKIYKETLSKYRSIIGCDKSGQQDGQQSGQV